MTAKPVIVSGLPGSGKSAVAEGLGVSLMAPVFAKDWLEASLLESAVVTRGQLGMVGYSLLTTLARRQLELGQTAILDGVAGLTPIRESWRTLCKEFQGDWFIIECICSDERVHRERLVQRQRGIPGWPELEWSEVERVRSYFIPWSEDRLVLDSMDSLDSNVSRAIAYVGSLAVNADPLDGAL